MDNRGRVHVRRDWNPLRRPLLAVMHIADKPAITYKGHSSPIALMMSRRLVSRTHGDVPGLVTQTSRFSCPGALRYI